MGRYPDRLKIHCFSPTITYLLPDTNTLSRVRLQIMLLFLLTQTLTQGAWAMGLGDIHVESALGQPFKASINLLGSKGAEVDESCFRTKPSAGDVPGIRDVLLKIQKTPGGAKILLTSRHIVNDPAVAINVVMDCPERITRQYMVLLDLPLIAEAPRVVSNAVVPSAPVATKPQLQASSPAVPHVQTRKKASGRAQSRRKAVHVRHPKTRNSKTGPRLILSTKNLPGSNVSASGSKPAQQQPSTVNASEASDTQSAMLHEQSEQLDHKLAHLETQLTTLQQTYDQLQKIEQALKARKQAQKQQQQQDAQGKYSWILLFALIGASLLIAVYWRKRRVAPSYIDAIPQSTGLEHTVSSSPPPAFTAVAMAPAAVDSQPDSSTAIEEELPLEPGRGVEVDDSVIDEAEVFMAHGHADLAIGLLQEHVRTSPDESPVPWMLLLDLLKRSGMSSDYESASQVFRLYFNAHVPNFNESEPGPGSAGLEAYPHILAELLRVWKTPECRNYLDELVFDRRGGSRIGFDPPTFREIMLLRALANDDASLKTA
jgi:hypothetical protein